MQERKKESSVLCEPEEVHCVDEDLCLLLVGETLCDIADAGVEYAGVDHVKAGYGDVGEDGCVWALYVPRGLMVGMGVGMLSRACVHCYCVWRERLVGRGCISSLSIAAVNLQTQYASLIGLNAYPCRSTHRLPSCRDMPRSHLQLPPSLTTPPRFHRHSSPTSPNCTLSAVIRAFYKIKKTKTKKEEKEKRKQRT